MLPLARLRMLEGVMRLPGLRHRRNACASVYECLCCLVVGRVLLFPHDGGAGRNVMVYLVTKQLKYPLQRSFDDGGYVVRGATVA